MTEAELMQLLAAITPPDETARAAAHTHWASLANCLLYTSPSPRDS